MEWGYYTLGTRKPPWLDALRDGGSPEIGLFLALPTPGVTQLRDLILLTLFGSPVNLDSNAY